MAVTGFLAPSPVFQMRDKTGEPARAGKLFTYVAGTDTPKATYMDPGLTMPNTNPVVMNMAGTALIYWADDELYRIVAEQADGQEIYDQDNYPIVGPSDDTPITDIVNVANYVRNSQFTWWTNTIVTPPVMANVASSPNDNYDFMADDWLYAKTCADSVINISQGTFTPGQTEVPGGPVNYISYDCTNAGAGTETNSNLYQLYKSVQTLSGHSVTLLFSARCRNVPSASLLPHFYQYFGTGGSASTTVDNFLNSVTLTNAWQQFRQTIPLSNITGKNIGTSGTDALVLSFQFPSNLLCGIDISSVQFTDGQNTLDFILESQNDQRLRIYRDVSQWFETGDYKISIRPTASPGWVVCDDGTIGNPYSNATHAGDFTKALFGYLWAFSNLYVPIFNSDGTAGSRTSANADFNLNKQLGLTKTLGRMLGAANPNNVGFNKIFTASSSSGLLLSVDDTTPFGFTGFQVEVSAVGGGSLPTGLSPATTYYVVIVSGTTFHLATSAANAAAGSVIPFTNSGSGTLIVTGYIGTAQPGQYSGEFNGLPLVSTMAAHTHPFTANAGDFYSSAGTPAGGPGTDGPTFNLFVKAPTGTTGTTGGGNYYNLTQPSLFLYAHLKF